MFPGIDQLIPPRLMKICHNRERVDVQLEEPEEKEKKKGLELGSTCVNEGCLEREIGERLKK